MIEGRVYETRPFFVLLERSRQCDHGLSHPVRPEEPVHRTTLHRQIQAFHRRLPAAPDDEFLGLEGRSRSSAPLFLLPARRRARPLVQPLERGFEAFPEFVLRDPHPRRVPDEHAQPLV